MVSADELARRLARAVLYWLGVASSSEALVPPKGSPARMTTGKFMENGAPCLGRRRAWQDQRARRSP